MVFECLKGLFAVAGWDNDHKILLYFHIKDLFEVFGVEMMNLDKIMGLKIDKDRLALCYDAHNQVCCL